MDDMGHRTQVMRHDIRPLYAEAKVVGRAATMLAAEVYETPIEPYKLEMALLDELQVGDVVVCTTQGSRRSAVWGELLSTHTRTKGGRGAIMDGLSRDSWGIIAMKFPVFATGLTPADSKGRCDVIVADYDGCLAVPREIEDAVIGRAMQKVADENQIREILRQGASIQKVFKEYGIL